MNVQIEINDEFINEIIPGKRDLERFPYDKELHEEIAYHSGKLGEWLSGALEDDLTFRIIQEVKKRALQRKKLEAIC